MTARRGDDALLYKSGGAPSFEDVTVGMEVPDLIRGPIDVAHMARWTSAIQEWHKIHYDNEYAREHGFRGPVVNMSWWQHVIAKHLSEWLGEGGWLWRYSVGVNYTTFPIAGDTLTFWARVTNKYEQGGLGFVDFELGIRNQEGMECLTLGTATGVLPLGAGAVAYPFEPPK